MIKAHTYFRHHHQQHQSFAILFVLLYTICKVPVTANVKPNSSKQNATKLNSKKNSKKMEINKEPISPLFTSF